MSSAHRYIVIGAGAVGAALAAAFEQAGAPVVLVSRGKTFEAIRATGLSVRHNGSARVLPVDTVDGPAALVLTRNDVLIFAVKTQDAAAVIAEWAGQPVAGDTVAGSALVAVTIQNGLETERVALRHFDRVLAATTLIGAQHIVPGQVDIVTTPHVGALVIGKLAPERTDAAADDALDDLVADARTGGWQVTVTDEPAAHKAWKTAIAATFAVEVLAGGSDDLDHLRVLVRDEAFAVLAGAGIAVSQRAVAPTAPQASTLGAPTPALPNHFSTWQSFARGSGSEVDYLAGEIALIARQHGLNAPYNTALQRVLAASAARTEPPGTRHIDEVFAIARAYATHFATPAQGETL